MYTQWFKKLHFFSIWPAIPLRDYIDVIYFCFIVFTLLTWYPLCIYNTCTQQMLNECIVIVECMLIGFPTQLLLLNACSTTWCYVTLHLDVLFLKSGTQMPRIKKTLDTQAHRARDTDLTSRRQGPWSSTLLASLCDTRWSLRSHTDDEQGSFGHSS